MIPRTVFVVAEPFAAGLSAACVADAIGRGLREGARSWELDLCPLEAPAEDAQGIQALLRSLDFDARMRRAHTVVIARARLDHETLLRGGSAFEIATRARQSGVPTYAVAEDALDPFEARILDLQAVLEARSPRSLASAGKRLGDLI